MKIQGTVYCNCFEQEKMDINPEFSQLIQIDYDGALVMLTENEEQEILFSEWKINACQHANGILSTHLFFKSIEELHTIQDIFSVITEEEDFDCPILYNYFLYNETEDTNDLIPLKDLLPLIEELKNLKPFVENSDDNIFIDFFKNITELSLNAIKNQKPIALQITI